MEALKCVGRVHFRKLTWALQGPAQRPSARHEAVIHRHQETCPDFSHTRGDEAVNFEKLKHFQRMILKCPKFPVWMGEDSKIYSQLSIVCAKRGGKVCECTADTF